MMKFVLAIVAVLVASQAAFADSTCDTRASEKKLAGAAKTSFLKKCEKDARLEAAQQDCTAKAADKKLKGAAKNSFTTKCVKDATK